jgi:mRNA-degrading endonuclease RelE of RelBE toxin-antitoxin system
MNYEVIPTENFGKKLKRLKKKYPLIGVDIRDFASSDNIEANINAGEQLGRDCHKLRMKISGKNSGKSGGARIIVQAKVIDKKVYLLTIYDKGDQETVTDKEIDKLIARIGT